MRPLERLRLRLTAWYVLTITATLVALGLGLFVAVSAQIGVKLDRSLREAADAVVAEVRERAAAESRGRPADRESLAGIARGTLEEVHIPDRALYLFDTNGAPLAPDTASRWARDVARRAARQGSAAAEVSIGNEHTLRLVGSRFEVLPGRALVTVAAADTEELEDEYARLIALFAGTLVAALVLVAAGGSFLARKSSQPVERSFEQMRRFMADAAHELRTPVAILRTQLDVALQRPRDADTYAGLLRDLRTETERLSAIVDDLFTLARAESGEQQVERRPVYLDDVALSAVERTRALAVRHEVRLSVGQYDEAPILADPRLVEQLVVILVDNAIKYSPAGARVTVSVQREDGAAVLCVADGGVGIPADAVARVFDRFYRGAEARARGDGAGLGLAIARWIAEAHGAEIAIESAPAAGTVVRVRFPTLDRAHL